MSPDGIINRFIPDVVAKDHKDILHTFDLFRNSQLLDLNLIKNCQLLDLNLIENSQILDLN